MTRERPGVILGLGLADLAVGTLCIFMGLGTLGRRLLMLVMDSSSAEYYTQPIKNRNMMVYTQPEVPNAFAYLESKYPGYTVFDMGYYWALFLAGLLLVAVGIGLLHMRPWARWMGIFYSICMLFGQLAFAWVQFAFIWPAIADFQRDFGQDFTRYYGSGSALQSYKLGFFFFLGIQVGVFLGHALAQLLVLILPSVGAAFAGTPEEELAVETTASGNGVAAELRPIEKQPAALGEVG